MLRHQVFALVLGLAVFNGIFSPLVLSVAAYSFVWAPAWLPASPGVTFYLSSLVLATSTLLLSGVPAALMERAFPATRGTVAPVWLWVAGAGILCFPAFVRLLLVSGVAR